MGRQKEHKQLQETWLVRHRVSWMGYQPMGMRKGFLEEVTLMLDPNE